MDHRARDIIALYQRHADAFARLRAPLGREERWLSAFCNLLPENGSVLDLGCGFGTPVGAALIDAGFRVTGVDTSAPLIDRARRSFPEQDWLVADMRALTLRKHFDGVLAWNSFFHLTPDDQRAMFETFASHAGVGGALMFTAGPAAGTAMGEFEGDALYHASLDPNEYESLLAQYGFSVVDYVAEDPEAGGQTVWLAQRTAG